MRVLVVAVDRPWPARSGGARRVAALIDAIAKVAEVRVVVATRKGDDISPIGEAAPPSVGEVVHVERSPSTARAVVRALVAIARGRPLITAFYRDSRARRVVRDQFEAFRPDVIVTHHLGGAAVVDGIVPPEQVILDLADNEAERFTRSAASARRLHRARFALDAALVRSWVARNLARYRAVVTVSERDARSYREMSAQATVVVAENGADPRAAPRADPINGRVLFVGDMAYRPNLEAVEWFAGEVLGALPEQLRDVKLRVVGRGGRDVGTSVEAVGFVADLSAEWAEAACLVVPLRSGGGTRLKVLEAMAHGVPVISTGLGVEGIDVIVGEHVLTAERPSEWTAALELLLGDPALRERLGRAGHALVTQRYAWDVTMRAVTALVSA